jgi:pyrroline-5-carboxylate reductase
MKQTITFIGGGNMATSIIGGLIQSGHPAQTITVCDPHSDKREALSAQFGIHTLEDNLAACANADVIVIAVKPQAVKSALLPLNPLIKQNQPLLLSIVVGITTDTFETWLSHEISLVRTMPNTPALFSCGATGLYANKNTTQSQKDTAESLMRAVGISLWVEKESLLDAVTALSGCGPAYFFLIMEAMSRTAQEMGLKATDADLLSAQTALGAAHMALQSDDTLSTLRERVTSKGGATAAAIEVLQANQIDAIFERAMQAAKSRSEALANTAKNNQ